MERQDAKDAKTAKERRFYREPSPKVDALASAVIRAAITVHRELGPGFLESFYEEALVLELTARQISFGRQVALPVYYGEICIGESRIDLLVDELLVVELKAVEELRQVHRAQVLSYLRAGSFELGLLINFNVVQLIQGVRRVVSSC
jgi:GxxExxY protein